MSFSNPFSTKTAGTSTITAAEVNAAGVSISRALDGAAGGTYTPSSPLAINGSGLSTTTALSCGAASTATLAGTNVLSGTNTLSGPTTASGSFTASSALISTGTASFAGPTQFSNIVSYVATTLTDADTTITPNYFTYYLPQPTATRTVSVNTGVVGQRIRFARSVNGAFQWRIKRTGSSNYVVLLDNESRSCAEIEYTSGGWVLVMYSPDALPGVDAE